MTLGSRISPDNLCSYVNFSFGVFITIASSNHLLRAKKDLVHSNLPVQILCKV